MMQSCQAFQVNCNSLYFPFNRNCMYIEKLRYCILRNERTLSLIAPSVSVYLFIHIYMELSNVLWLLDLGKHSLKAVVDSGQGCNITIMLAMEHGSSETDQNIWKQWDRPGHLTAVRQTRASDSSETDQDIWKQSNRQGHLTAVRQKRTSDYRWTDQDIWLQWDKQGHLTLGRQTSTSNWRETDQDIWKQWDRPGHLKAERQTRSSDCSETEEHIRLQMDRPGHLTTVRQTRTSDTRETDQLWDRGHQNAVRQLKPEFGIIVCCHLDDIVFLNSSVLSCPSVNTNTVNTSVTCLQWQSVAVKPHILTACHHHACLLRLNAKYKWLSKRHSYWQTRLIQMLRHWALISRWYMTYIYQFAMHCWTVFCPIHVVTLFIFTFGCFLG